MRKLGLMLLALAPLATANVACRHDENPAGEEIVAPENTTLIMGYRMASGATEVKEAPFDGTYLLYRAGKNEVEFSKALNKGEKIGFEKAETGSVTAVAGAEKRTIPDANYTWVRK